MMSLEQPPPALQVKLLSPTAKPPTRGSAFAAGYDLYASSAATVPARGKALVDTDISIAVPAGTYGRVAPRSGLASKHSIDVGAGVIDADYRGPVKVLLFNFSDREFEVQIGERVAQLIVERVSSLFFFPLDRISMTYPPISLAAFLCCFFRLCPSLVLYVWGISITDLLGQIYTPEVVVVEQLEESVRGAGGFGSTGGFGGVLPPLNGA